MNAHPLNLLLLEDIFVVCRLAHDAAVPEWTWQGGFVSVTRTDDELSIVCPHRNVPASIRCEPGWRCLRVAGTLSFSAIGIMAGLTAPLAEAGVSVFVVSTFDTDYVLVKEFDLPRATEALLRQGHVIR